MIVAAHHRRSLQSGHGGSSCPSRGTEELEQLVRRGATSTVRDWQFRATAAGWAMFFEKGAHRDWLMANARVDALSWIGLGRLDRLEDALEHVEGAPYRSEEWVRRVMRRFHGGEPHPVPEGERLGDPLRVAAMAGQIEIVDWLLDRGARPTPTGWRTGTFEFGWLARDPLGWAICCEHPAIRDRLLAAGARPRSLTPEHRLFLGACLNELDEVEAALAEGADIDRVHPFDQQMRTPVCAAVPHGVELVRALLDAGADPSIPTLFGKTVEVYAAGDPEILELLSRSR